VLTLYSLPRRRMRGVERASDAYCLPYDCVDLVRAASPDVRITRDFGGYVEEYKAKYAKAKARGERVIIDGICNSACTLVLASCRSVAFVRRPRASMGFHQAYYDKRWTAGLRVTSVAGTTS